MALSYFFSQNVDPLSETDHPATVQTMSSLSERVRERLRDEIIKQKLTQQEVADLIGAGWTQTRVAQKLHARSRITLDELEALCFALGLPISEIVRDRGLEFYAEMTPTEVRLLEQFRQRDTKEQDAFLTLFHVQRKTHAPERHARPLKNPKK